MNVYSCLIRDAENRFAQIKEIQITALNADYARIAVDINYPDYKLLKTPNFLRSTSPKTAILE